MNTTKQGDAMKTVSIKDFFEFGKLGNVQVGMLRQDVEQLFGYTDIIQQYENDFTTLTYGKSHFTFEDDVLICIQMETYGVADEKIICIGENVALNNEIFDISNQKSFRHIKETLEKNDIQFTEELNDSGTKMIKLSSGVTLDFNYASTDNIVLDNVSNNESAELASISHVAFC